jgi:hypothetical protein
MFIICLSWKIRKKMRSHVVGQEWYWWVSVIAYGWWLFLSSHWRGRGLARQFRRSFDTWKPSFSQSYGIPRKETEKAHGGVGETRGVSIFRNNSVMTRANGRQHSLSLSSLFAVKIPKIALKVKSQWNIMLLSIQILASSWSACPPLELEHVPQMTGISL